MHTAKGLQRSIAVMGIQGNSKFAQFEPTDIHDNPKIKRLRKKVLKKQKKKKVNKKTAHR